MSSRVLHYGLWVVQILLALMFLAAGVVKSTQPIADLAASMPWAGYSPPALVRFVGVSELLGGLGLVLPAATRIAPILTPLAALGLLVIMALAIPMHAMHGEAAGTPVNLVLGALAAFVAWGRAIKAPVRPR